MSDEPPRPSPFPQWALDALKDESRPDNRDGRFRTDEGFCAVGKLLDSKDPKAWRRSTPSGSNDRIVMDREPHKHFFMIGALSTSSAITPNVAEYLGIDQRELRALGFLHGCKLTCPQIAASVEDFDRGVPSAFGIVHTTLWMDDMGKGSTAMQAVTAVKVMYRIE